MNKPNVSIIIPVYNVETYLRECLDSVIKQTLKNIEIICVNDGSTDKSLQILEEYAQKDKRIEIISKTNSGYGHSMNIGLNNAKGEYIGIIESDDYAELNMFEELYNTAKKNELDLARCHFYVYNSKNNTNKKMESPNVPTNTVFAPIDEPFTFYQQPSIWAAIYKKELIINNNIRFLETPGASYQDASFAFKTYSMAKRFMMLNDALIHYRIDNENSSVNSKGKVFCVCDEYKEIENFVKKHNLQKKLKYIITRIKYNTYRWNFRRLANPERYQFLKRWSSEAQKEILLGKIDKKLFSEHELKNLKKIAFLPILFKNKENL